MNAESPKTVLETILEWSADRPLWQRDALRRIVTGGMPDDVELGELLSLCKKEHGAADIDVAATALEARHLPAQPGNGASISLVSMSSIVGVNQLASEQTLPFEADGLTIIYGPNGAGKSGYGRVLKRACRARRPGEIMPDAYSPPPAGKATATFDILIDGTAADPIHWVDGGMPDAILSAVSVFDRDCGSVHVQEKNEVAFRPFGLDIPDDLAGVCQKLKQLLASEAAQLQAKRNTVFDSPIWHPGTSPGKILSGLAHDTNLATLEALGAMTSNERARLERLSEDLQKNPLEAAAAQRVFAGGVRNLIAAIDDYAETYADAKVSAVKGAADSARSKRAAANLAAQRAFSELSVPGVGDDAWRTLWEAARRYAEHTAYPGTPFPHEGDELCVLCHQPLASEAKIRLRTFEEFIEADIEAQATAAEAAYRAALEAFRDRKIDARLISHSRQQVGVQHPTLARAVLRFTASADLRRRQCLASLTSEVPLSATPLAASPKADLEAIESSAWAYATELDAATNEEGRRSLLRERDELADRAIVPDLIEIARTEVNRLRAVRVGELCTAQMATNTITRLGNDIADNVITPKMRDQFQSEIVRLAAEKVRVEIVRSGGQYGSPNYQVRLFASPKAKVHNVLSEGEQTCVALAAFLTELATAPHKSALVFDDPVTSLDHRWRNKVAERLVEESATRQIIVFTHDMVYVNDLHDKAHRRGVPIKLVSLSRGPTGTGIVSDGLPWQHASLKDRIDKLEKEARAARALYDANDEEGYRETAVRIYNRLRASWERGLEDVVFAGVILRHRDYIDAKNLKKVTAMEAADADVYRMNFKRCSDLVEAHDPSRGRDAFVPPPTDLLADIKALADWAAALRAKQSAIS